jgi:signal transduction histidine kinase/CheY-like chemotaxis protein
VEYDAVMSDVLDGMTSAAVTFSRDGKLRAANATAHTLFAIDTRAPLSSQAADVVLSSFAPEVLPLLQQALADATPREWTLRLRYDERWYYVRVVSLNTDRVQLTACDVTRRERTRESMEAAERELGAVFELTPSSVWVADVTGGIVRRNGNAVAAFGAQQPESMRALWELERASRVGSEATLTFTEHPAMRALSGQVIRREPLMVRRDGFDDPRLIECNAAPMRDASGHVMGVVLMNLDVTDQRLTHLIEHAATPGNAIDERVRDEAQRLEKLVEERAKTLAAREDAVARDRRLAAIGQLAAGVMHDVNNALNPIMAAAYLLRHHAESPDAVRDYADRIKKAAETGAATASRVGRFIRQEPVNSGADEVLDLSALAEEVLALTDPMRHRRPGSPSDVQVVRSYDAAALTRGVPGEIREALLNLVSNAADAMPHGGTLTVRTTVDRDEAMVIVQDDGVGMNVDVQERAFEPFFTTKGAGGSGLGLAEVYGIVRRHRGAVSLVSAPGAGTTVSLRFPRERVAAPTVASEAPSADSSPQHILVVEDHEDGREFLRRLLHSGGHTVDAVGTCAEARERLASAARSGYHLLLTDVGLPDGSGWDLVAFARERLPALRVGVITGWEPMVSSTESAGAEFVMRKPIHAAELLSHIARRQALASSE